MIYIRKLSHKYICMSKIWVTCEKLEVRGRYPNYIFVFLYCGPDINNPKIRHVGEQSDHVDTNHKLFGYLKIKRIFYFCEGYPI